jgi:class 3 adenylate cyclase
VQRRQLSVLFCDLVGSTTLSEQVDPEELRELVQDYQRVCSEAIARFEGHTAQYLGDGIVVYFGYPTAHEDDARRAVHSALSILAGMKQLNLRLQAEKNLTLAVRIGIDTGTVVLEEEICFGETPNIAARLQNLAPKNGIVISASTRKLVGSFFDCKDLGEHQLKGISQPMLVYEVLQARDIYRRLEISRQNLTPFVNRKQELNTLLEIWEQVKSGNGQVVLLFGDAGLGKSRLVQEFQQRITIESYALRECYCSSYYQDTAFYPLLDMLRNISVPHGEQIKPNQSELDEKTLKTLPELGQNYVQIPESDLNPSEQRQKIESLFDSVLSLVSPERSALYPTPQQKKQNLLSVIEQMLLNLAAQLPVLMVVEDLHWSDPSTLELLGLLVEQIPKYRILLLTTARAEFDLPWSGLEQVSQIQLNRLFEEIEPIARGLVGGKKLPDELIYLLKLKTDGIPLFVEEMTRMVLESGWLTETEDAYRLNLPIHSLAIPTTLQDMLMARLDRLKEGKEIIQIGATIGR